MILSDASIDQWLDSLRVNGMASNTLRAYRSDLRTFRAWQESLSHAALISLEGQAGTWLNLTRNQTAAKTTRRRLTSLRSYAKFHGEATFLHGYRPPTPAEPQPHPLPGGLDDVILMTQVAHSPSAKALIALCGLCGLRVGEAISMRLTNLHHLAGGPQLHIRGKGDRERWVPVSDRAWAVLEARLLQIATDGGTDDPLLAPYPDRTARALITRLGNQAGIARPVSSHDLRATAATAWYTATKDIRAVQKLMGHSSVETTQVYVNVTQEQLRQVVNS